MIKTRWVFHSYARSSEVVLIPVDTWFWLLDAQNSAASRHVSAEQGTKSVHTIQPFFLWITIRVEHCNEPSPHVSSPYRWYNLAIPLKWAGSISLVLPTIIHQTESCAGLSRKRSCAGLGRWRDGFCMIPWEPQRCLWRWILNRFMDWIIHALRIQENRNWG